MNLERAAFVRHESCPLRAMIYFDGGAECGRSAGGCGQRWTLRILRDADGQEVARRYELAGRLAHTAAWVD